MNIRRFFQYTRFQVRAGLAGFNAGRIVGSQGTNLAASPRIHGQNPDLSCKAHSAEDQGIVPHCGERDRSQLRCATSSMGVA